MIKRGFTPLEIENKTYPFSKRREKRDCMRQSLTGPVRKHFSNRAGFTLIELIVVIAIIAILAAIIAPNAYRAIEKAQVQKAIADMKAIGKAALQHYADTGRYPPAVDNPPYGAGFLTNDDGSGNPVPGWDGPYLEQWPSHPWSKKVVDPTTYQWDYKDVQTDGFDDWTVEIGLGDVNATRRNYIAGMIDKFIDAGDGPCAGLFQGYPPCNQWATWPKYIVVDGRNE